MSPKIVALFLTLALAGAPVTENGRPVEAPGIDLYRGTVLGDADSHARLSVTDEWARGYVYAFGTMYDLQTLDDQAVLRAASGIERPTLIDYEATELGSGSDKQGITGCLGAVPEVTLEPLGIVTGWGTQVTYDIIVVSDKPFTERYSDWAASQLSHMNRIDGYYTNNFNIQIQVVAQSADTAGTIYTSSSSGGLLSQLRNAWLSDGTARETVHLLSERDFNGNTVGQAYCIGGAHSKLLHYTVTQTDGYSEFAASEITAHEFGHMMSAHHHYSNCHDTALSPSTQPCTVMTPAVNFLNNAVIFSMLSRSTIREYGEDVL